MPLNTIIRALPFSIASLFLMTACNGPSDDNDTGSGGEGSYSISLSYQSVVNGQCAETTDELRFDVTERFCAVAQLKQSNSNVSGAIVSFAPNFGQASVDSTLTNSSGIASVFISTTDNTVGAGTLVVSHTPTDTESETDDSVSASRNFEFINSTTTPTPETITINASITQAGQTVTRFKIDQAVLLTAAVLDGSNQPIADQLVSFQAGSASLSPNTALTSTDGIATVSYTPNSSELGAYSLIASTDFDGTTISGSSAYEVLSGDEVIPEGTIKFGYFVDDETFIEDKLGSTLIADDPDADPLTYTIGAGASFGVYADVIIEAADGTFEPLQTPVSVSFSSDCVANGDASLDTPVTTSSGRANSTFQDSSCSGNSIRSQRIIAAAVIGNDTYNANFDFSLERQTLGSLSFISAEPNQIRIKGAGGTGSTESSLVTFLISSANGQPAAQQKVTFGLDTVIGGLKFANGDEAISNANGLVSVTVQSGTVPTPVRVSASAEDKDSGIIITTQSEQLTVNTGLPQQLGFNISPSLFNPEAADVNGVEVTMTAYASDSFGNPAPDDTTINFTAEGGQIQPSCLTVNGSCSVVWTSTDPRPTDHRVTVLAYALGHETFFDTNGNNIFDDADAYKNPESNFEPTDDGAIINACLDTDGVTLVACTGNGMDIETYHQSGYSDLGDAFRDDDETGVYVSGKPFFSALGKSSYSGPDGKFNGPQCEGSLCGEGQANKTYIRAATILTMSGSTATIITSDDNGAFGDSPVSPESMTTVEVELYDSANQMMPAGSTLTVAAVNGSITFSGYTVPNATCFSFKKSDATHSCNQVATQFSYTAADETGEDIITLTVTTPRGIKTEESVKVTVQ
ncbi:Ig-like domain-containing protein [Shewanella sp. 6_MG-2023]|uniref:Ig-like domain-containing protein n=1 Tax=Shewanella sp. 6_MG-2023 TaxID=3062660 RepID=UPI0026E13B71|nr:Ig-like domain-containing protein [Shewanella sp. 6_MG-2023]MDO6618738.1 Ig-like domain-containing protein [Shewanella sp. 6_MG-2023]